MNDFKIVPDDLRRHIERPGGLGAPTKPEYDALVEGKTVFFPANGVDRHRLANRIRSALVARKKSGITRAAVVDGEEGVLAWVTGDREVQP